VLAGAFERVGLRGGVITAIALGSMIAVATLQRLEASGYAYLVDLSIADFKLLNPGASDVVQNDVFWSLAGWL
jgi:uncharacterized membrane protein